MIFLSAEYGPLVARDMDALVWASHLYLTLLQVILVQRYQMGIDDMERMSVLLQDRLELDEGDTWATLARGCGTLGEPC